MQIVKVIDKSIPNNYRGGYSATIMPWEHEKIRPQENPRRLDFVFREKVIVEMDLDMAKFLQEKYPDRFIFVNLELEEITIEDELDTLPYADLKDILIDLNKQADELNLPKLSLIVKKEVIRDYIREQRILIAETRQKIKQEEDSKEE